jgi:hypothetical protein
MRLLVMLGCGKKKKKKREHNKFDCFFRSLQMGEISTRLYMLVKGVEGADDAQTKALFARSLFFLRQATKLSLDNPSSFSKLGNFLHRHSANQDEAEDALLRCIELSFEQHRTPESRAIRTLISITEDRGDTALAQQV